MKEFSSAIETVVSSANNVTWRLFEIFGKSLIYKRKHIGPKMLPWGRPIVVIELELEEPILRNILYQIGNHYLFQ